MNVRGINAAVAEAKRFIERAAAVKRSAGLANDNIDILWGTKETGALRRASLDLTRALSEMRKL